MTLPSDNFNRFHPYLGTFFWKLADSLQTIFHLRLHIPNDIVASFCACTNNISDEVKGLCCHTMSDETDLKPKFNLVAQITINGVRKTTLLLRNECIELRLGELDKDSTQRHMKIPISQSTRLPSHILLIIAFSLKNSSFGPPKGKRMYDKLAQTQTVSTPNGIHTILIQEKMKHDLIKLYQ